MPDNLCPICQRPNDANAERCWYCQAVLSHEDKPENNGNTDWLNSFREDSAISVEPFPPESTTEETEDKEEEVPDWLARIRTREQMERESAPKEEPEAKAEDIKEDLPDWLKEIKAGNSGIKSDALIPEEPQESHNPLAPEEIVENTTLPSSTQKEQDDTEEWLSHLAAWKPVENLPSASETPGSVFGNVEPEQSEPSQPDIENEFQVHLNSLSGTDDKEKQPVELNSAEGWHKLIPDQAELEPEPPLQSESVESPQIEPQEEKTLEAPVIGPDEIVFDVESLRDELVLQEPSPAPETERVEHSFSPIEEDVQPADSNVVDRLFDLTDPEEEVESSTEPTPAFLKSKPGTAPFLHDDLPDWLASATIEKGGKKPVEAVSEELDSSVLEKADLPAWLQAIRPTPDKAIGESEPEPEISQVVEEKGLLAGIAGTLQSSQISGDFRKPVGYGSALKVSERQKTNANIFASLVRDNLEDADVEVPKNQKMKSTIFRLALGAVLIIIILFGNTLMAGLTISPALFPPEVVAVYDKINALPTDKTVLLTGDFEPAVAGELSWSSQTLLEHMMRRNLNFAVLSTNPTGAAILMQQLETVSQKVPGYDVTSHVIDLGYLPGGSTGLQLMTEDIRMAVPNLYDVYDVHAAWNSPILQPVNSISDFGATIVFSDKAESARVWVEQIQPALGAAPLLFVISAQAAPMIEPYYQSGQVSGYVGGFSGSLAYEAIFQQSSNSTSHLGAFQASILLIAVLFLLGGLVNLIRPSAPERKGDH